MRASGKLRLAAVTAMHRQPRRSSGAGWLGASAWPHHSGVGRAVVWWRVVVWCEQQPCAPCAEATAAAAAAGDRGLLLLPLRGAAAAAAGRTSTPWPSASVGLPSCSQITARIVATVAAAGLHCKRSATIRSALRAAIARVLGVRRARPEWVPARRPRAKTLQLPIHQPLCGGAVAVRAPTTNVLQWCCQLLAPRAICLGCTRRQRRMHACMHASLPCASALNHQSRSLGNLGSPSSSHAAHTPRAGRARLRVTAGGWWVVCRALRAPPSEGRALSAAPSCHQTAWLACSLAAARTRAAAAQTQSCGTGRARARPSATLPASPPAGAA